jgi:hypothetical protein
MRATLMQCNGIGTAHNIVRLAGKKKKLKGDQVSSEANRGGYTTNSKGTGNTTAW